MTALHKAAIFNHLEVIRALLQADADIEAKGLKYGKLHLTPLHLATEAGNLEAVRLLIESGADVQCQESNVSPLHMAAGLNNLEIVKLLIDQGAKVNARDWQDRTPLYWASRTKSELVIEFLRKKGGVL